MAASRFVNVSDEDISQFLEENENKNTARKTSRYVINKLLHVESLISFLFKVVTCSAMDLVLIE